MAYISRLYSLYFVDSRKYFHTYSRTWISLALCLEDQKPKHTTFFTNSMRKIHRARGTIFNVVSHHQSSGESINTANRKWSKDASANNYTVIDIEPMSFHKAMQRLILIREH